MICSKKQIMITVYSGSCNSFMNNDIAHNLHVSSCKIKGWRDSIHSGEPLSCVHNYMYDDQSCLDIFLCSSNIWSFFIYSFAFFIIYMYRYRYITNSYTDWPQLPHGLIAQLVEHCTGIAGVLGLNPIQTLIFFLLTCNDQSCLPIFLCSLIISPFIHPFVMILHVRTKYWPWIPKTYLQHLKNWTCFPPSTHRGHV